MERNTVYKLNKKLELKNENFLVKKGTIATIFEKFNEIDNDKPTVVSLKFENIIGEYQFDEKELEELLEKNVFKSVVTKFKVNDSVKTADFGNECGIIVKITLESGTDKFSYVVVFSGIRYTISESRLSKCS